MLAFLDHTTARPLDFDNRKDWSDFSLTRIDPIPEGLGNDYAIIRYGRLCAALLFEPPSEANLLLPTDPCYSSALEKLMNSKPCEPRTVAEYRDALWHHAPHFKMNNGDDFDPAVLGRTYLENRARFGFGTRHEWVTARWGAYFVEDWTDVEITEARGDRLCLTVYCEAEEYFPVRFFEHLAGRHPDLPVHVTFFAEDSNGSPVNEFKWESPARPLVPARHAGGLGG
jgi:hypothetical protein